MKKFLVAAVISCSGLVVAAEMDEQWNEWEQESQEEVRQSERQMEQEQMEQEGIGGSGQSMDQQSQDELYESEQELRDYSEPSDELAPPAEPMEPGEGGSGLAPSDDITPAPVVVVPPSEANEEDKKKGLLTGFTLMAGGGVEGHTSTKADLLNPGPAWGVTAGIKPWKALGVELGYTGSALEAGLGEVRNGADVLRNGGNANLTVGLPLAFQPYVLGGIGVSHYNVRGSSETLKDDTVGEVPVGGGLRTQFGKFTADARFTYDFLFDDEFAQGPITGNSVNGDSYRGTINLGGTF